MIDATITQWVVLLLTVSNVLAMAMLPALWWKALRMEMKGAEQQKQIDKLDEVLGSMLAGRLGQNNRPLPLLPPIPTGKEK